MRVSAVFEHVHRVTYAECTLGNHIYYARYLELLEVARGELFRSLGTTFLEWQNKDTVFPVIECHISYKGPARYDDLLHIQLWVTKAERVRLNFGYKVINQRSDLILEAETFHVCTGLDDKPKQLPEQLRRTLEPYLNQRLP